MGYESRIYVVDYHKRTNWGEVICMMNMCVMDPNKGFADLFKDGVDYDVFLQNGDYPTVEDNYGDPITDTSIQSVIDWLENNVKENDYRRLSPCLAMLKGFEPQQWDDLRVVHYGY